MKKTLAAIIITLMFFSFPADASAQSSQTLNLRPGFNFISFTVGTGLVASQFMAMSPGIEDIYSYSAAAGAFISAREATLSKLSAGRGYIVKYAGSERISMAIAGNPSFQSGNISISAGYNLVGFSRVPSPLTFSQVINNYSWFKSVHSWNPASGSFISVVRGNDGRAVMIDGFDPAFKAGESYFMNAVSATTINYDGAQVVIGGGTVTVPSGGGTVVPPAGTAEVPLEALSEIPISERIPGSGEIFGKISIQNFAYSPGAPGRAIVIKNLSNIRVWIKDHPEISGLTNDAGEFTLRNVPATASSAGHTVEYEKVEEQNKFAGVVRSVPVFETKKLDLSKYLGPLVIKPTGAIQGRVLLSDGQSPLGGEAYIAGISNMISKIDDDGTFSLMYVPEGTFTVTYQYPGYEIQRRQATVVSGEIKQIATVTLRKIAVASAFSSLDGYVMDDEGTPVPGAQASLASVATGQESLSLSSATGRYQFAGLQAGSYRLVFSRDGYRGSSHELTLSAGEGRQLNSKMSAATDTRPSHGLISGFVRDSRTNAPLRNAVIYTEPPTAQFFTDANGYFTQDALPGLYTLCVRRAGYFEKRSTLSVAAGKAGEVATALDPLPSSYAASIALDSSNIVMRQGEQHQFVASVRDAGGNLLSGKQCSWASSNSSAGGVSSQGLFVAASPGLCSVTASVDGLSARVDVNVLPSSNSIVSIRIVPQKAEMPIDEVRSFSAVATYSDGQVRVLDPAFVEWSHSGGLTAIGKGVFTASAAGGASVRAAYERSTSEALITVSASGYADSRPPVIVHTPVAMLALTDATVEAGVSDNVGVGRVELFVRKPFETAYQRLEMTRSTGSAFTRSIPSSEITAAGLYYYIQATDTRTPLPNVTLFPAAGPVAPLLIRPSGLVQLRLSQDSVEVQTGTVYDASSILATAVYSGGATRNVPVSWKLASGPGSLSGSRYTTPPTEGTAGLRAYYSEGGAEVSAALTVVSRKNPFIGATPDGKGWTGRVFQVYGPQAGMPAPYAGMPPAATFLTPVISVPATSFDLGFPGASGLTGNFLVRYTARVVVASQKEHLFRLSSSDESRLFIDNVLVIDNAGSVHAPSRTGNATLSAGEHAVVVDFYRSSQTPLSIQLQWNASGVETVLPVEATARWDGSRTPVALTLSRTSDGAALKRPYSLADIKAFAAYSDNTTAEASVSWAVARGAGAVSGYYFVPLEAGQAFIRANYSENGTTVGAELALSVLDNVAAPEFSPPGGNFRSAQTVVLTSATSGALIRYTTDGTVPSSTTGTLYSGGIPVSDNVTIRAVAFAEGMADSIVVSREYAVNASVTPALPFSEDFSAGIAAYWVRTGTRWIASEGAASSSIPETYSVEKLYAGDQSWANYSVSANLTGVSGQERIMTFRLRDENNGYFAWITGTGGSKEARLGKYVNGQWLTLASTPYPLPADGTVRLRADVFNSSINLYADDRFLLSVIDVSYPSGGVGFFNYSGASGNNGMRVDDISVVPLSSLKASAPVFDPPAGSYPDVRQVRLVAPTAGSVIRFTIDGSDPLIYGSAYTGAIIVDRPLTIRAVAVRQGLENSEVAVSRYIIGGEAASWPGVRRAAAPTDAVGGRFVVAGGQWQAGEPSGTTSVFVIDPYSGSTTTYAGVLPYGAFNCCAAAGANGKIYITPGLGSHLNNEWGTRRRIIELDPVSMTAVEKADFGMAIWGSAIAAGPGGRLFVFGGSNGSPQRSVWTYDPALDRLTLAGTLAGPARSNIRAISSNDGKIYLLGGSVSGGTQIEIFDPVALTSRVSAATIPDQFTGQRIAFQGMDGKMYVSSDGSAIHEYDPVKDSIRTITVSAGPGRDLAVALRDAASRKVFIAGGGAFRRDASFLDLEALATGRITDGFDSLDLTRWHPSSGSWGISGGKLHGNGSLAQQYSHALIFLDERLYGRDSDYEMSFDSYNYGGGAQIYFAGDSDPRLWHISLAVHGSRFIVTSELYPAFGSVPAVIDRVELPTANAFLRFGPSDPNRIRLSKNGGRFALFVNGSFVRAFSDPAHSGKGRIGFGAHGDRYYDSFETAPMAPASPVPAAQSVSFIRPSISVSPNAVVPLADAVAEVSYSEGSRVLIAPSPGVSVTWNQVSGGGSISGGAFTAPAASGRTTLLLTVFEDGASRTASLTIDTVTGTVQDNRIVGWWRFDEAAGNTALDSSSSAKHGAVSGAAVWVPGISGGALSFDGSTLVDCGANAVFDPDLNSYTISALVKMQPKPDDGRNQLVIAGKTNADATSSGFRLSFDQATNSVSFRVAGEISPVPGDTAEDTGSISISDGKWHHVAGVIDRDASRIKIFVDGVLRTSVPLSANGPVRSAGKRLLIGALYSEAAAGYMDHFKGVMDDLRIYNYAFFDAEVRTLFNGYSIP